MLKKLTKYGEYTHFLIIGITLLFFIISSPVNFSVTSSNLYPVSLGSWIFEFVSMYPLLGEVINIILIVLTSLYVNKIGTSTEILPRQSYITLSLLAIFLLFSPDAKYFTGSLLCMLLLTFSFDNMVGIFGKQYPFKQVLNSTIAISVSSLIVPQSLIFIVFVWLGFLTYSVNSLREWVISIIGILIPYIYMVFAFYWNDNIEYMLELYRAFFYYYRLQFSTPNVYQIISLIILAVIYFSSMMYFINNASEKIINIRKRMMLTFHFSFVSIVALIISSTSYFTMLPIVFVTMSIMLSYAVHYQKKSRFQDFLMIILLISIIFNRFNF
jgi:hypothetical protein